MVCPHKAESKEKHALSDSYKDTNPIWRAPRSWPYPIVLTSQSSHLPVPLQSRVGFNKSTERGHKHSVHIRGQVQKQSPIGKRCSHQGESHPRWLRPQCRWDYQSPRYIEIIYFFFCLLHLHSTFPIPITMPNSSKSQNTFSFSFFLEMSCAYFQGYIELILSSSG